MRKTTIAAAMTATAMVLAGTQATSAQLRIGDYDEADALGKVLAGEGLSMSEKGEALLNRLSVIGRSLNAIADNGIQDDEIVEYRRLYNDGLRVLDLMDKEIAATASSESSAEFQREIVAGYRTSFTQRYGRDLDTESGRGVDYVRVCDAFGSNYYYIPGTETCLRISGNVRAGVSWIENTHQLGGGTVVTNGGGDGNENFAARFGKWIQRGGVDLDFRTSGDYGGASLGKFPIVGLYGGYEGAWGDADYAGDAMVGYDGVTGVGYTYFEPAPSTGAIAGSAGFGIETQGHLDNSWNRANFGLKVALPVGDGDTGPRVRGRLGVFYEDLKTSASGNTQLTYNGSPYAGYSQQWDLDAKDRYYGIRTGVHIGFKPQFDGKLKTSIGGDLYLGYHSGEGSYQQYSQAGGAPIMQMVDYSKNGFSVGGALTASATYEFAPGWRLGGEAEFSCLPSVTSFIAPQNPNEQADAGFSRERATRVFLRARLTRSF